MGIVTARFVFLAFLGLTGTIIYNALYLQHPQGPAVVSGPGPLDAGVSPNSTVVGVTNVPPVSADLPPLDVAKGESQLLVRAIQRELAARDYEVGPVDGRLTDKTKAAISSYERREDLPVTGAPSDDLLRHILLGDSVKAVATGSVAGDAAPGGTVATVKRVQATLADLGYAPGPVDGALGSATAGAIKAFQRDRDIESTGRITSELLSELKRVTGHDLTKTAANP